MPGTVAAKAIGVVPIVLILGLLFMQVNMLVAALSGMATKVDGICPDDTTAGGLLRSKFLF